MTFGQTICDYLSRAVAPAAVMGMLAGAVGGCRGDDKPEIVRLQGELDRLRAKYANSKTQLETQVSDLQRNLSEAVEGRDSCESRSSSLVSEMESKRDLYCFINNGVTHPFLQDLAEGKYDALEPDGPSEVPFTERCITWKADRLLKAGFDPVFSFQYIKHEIEKGNLVSRENFNLVYWMANGTFSVDYSKYTLSKSGFFRRAPLYGGSVGMWDARERFNIRGKGQKLTWDEVTEIEIFSEKRVGPIHWGHAKYDRNGPKKLKPTARNKRKWNRKLTGTLELLESKAKEGHKIREFVKEQ